MLKIKNISLLLNSLVLIIASMLVSCAPTNKNLNRNNDPLEPINRKVYQFNKTVDALYINPISQIYIKTIPQPLKQLVNNFLKNISEVPTIINCIMQAEFTKARNSTARLVINTTLGIGGLLDIAERGKLAYQKEDLGNTLFYWGYKGSKFIMLPIIGPSTIRDSIGLIGNIFISVPYYFEPKWRNLYQATYMINKKSELAEAQSLLKSVSIDEYAMLRDSYIQNRDFRLNGNKNEELEIMDLPPE